MQIEYQSDVGRRRNTNQDYASVFTSRSGLKLAVLADGWVVIVPETLPVRWR